MFPSFVYRYTRIQPFLPRRHVHFCIVTITFHSVMSFLYILCHLDCFPFHAIYWKTNIIEPLIKSKSSQFTLDKLG